MMRSALTALALSQLAVLATGFSVQRPHQGRASAVEILPSEHEQQCVVDRRTAAVQSLAALGIVAFGGASAPGEAVASDMPEEFKNVGGQAPAPAGETPFRTLSDGVQVKEFRTGAGDAVVGDGSKVAVQLTGRLLNLNGVVFYDSKKNDPDGFGGLPVSFTVGDGTALPGLESGLRGMRKGGIRRIIVPPELGYVKFPGREPNPPAGSVERRALDSVIKNPRRDATLLFDAKLERVK